MRVKRKKSCLKFELFTLMLIFVHNVNAGCDFKTNYLCADGQTCIPKSYVCNNYLDCPSRDDEWSCDIRKCSDPEKFFLCRDKKTCIGRALICDEEPDCPDNSDESDELCDKDNSLGVSTTANTSTCNPDTHFKCKANNVCIPQKNVCNGVPNCIDGSDEDPKLCGKFEDKYKCKGFLCKNLKCLESSSYVCDGEDDCGDGSDEEHCSPKCDTANGKFLCTSGDECLDISKVCNNIPDCADKSDEGEHCRKDNSTVDECKDLNCKPPSECILLPTGPTCYCKKGYKINEKTGLCEDIDECLIFGTCSQGCMNMEGSFKCNCAKGFVLSDKDNRTCETLSSNASLVYTTKNYIKTINLGEDGPGIHETVTKTKQSIGVSYDGDSYYWTEVDMAREVIVKFNRYKNTREILLTNGLELPEYIAVDWLTKNIYFTDSTRQHVAVCTNDGYYCTELIKIEHMHYPRALALHPVEGLMFWTDWGNNSHIGVAFMDGSKAKILVDDVEWPNGLALDWPNRRIYWIDALKSTIETVTIHGLDRRVILKDVFKHPFALAVYGNQLYWSDHDTESIEVCDKFTGKNHAVVVQGYEIYDIHIYDESLMPIVRHGCEGNPCSHICLLKGDGKYSCACPTGMELNDDDHNCRFNSKSHLIHIGVGYDLYSKIFQSFGRSIDSTVKHTEVRIDKLEYNVLNGAIFYANNKEHKLYTLDSLGNSRLLLQDPNLHVTSMSFDYLGNNLYWADIMKETIEVLSLETKKRAIVHHYTGEYLPTSIVVVPSLGEIFVAQMSQKDSQITRVSMKGSSMDDSSFTTISRGIGRGTLYLAVDEAEKKLYWSDTKKKRIEFASFDGMDRKIFVQSERIPGPLTLVDDYIHWTSETSKSLQWRRKNGTGPIKLIRIESIVNGGKKMDFARVVPITAGYPIKINRHPCSFNNGNCSDICISDGPYKSICICAIGRVFMDKGQTKCVERTRCDARCSSGECIESKMVCDGTIDCLDRSDEDDKICHQPKCTKSQFKCNDGECIDKKYRCDLNVNCKDGSDELNCPSDGTKEFCGPRQYQCPNSTICIYRTQICDMNTDCLDGSDESEESCNQKCEDDEFKCLSGQCIPKDFKCDHKIDCYDGSDEDGTCSQMCVAPYKPCRDGHCIHERFFCDGVYDCEDKFDELNCTNDTKLLKCDENKFQCPSDPSICLEKFKLCNKVPDCPKGEDERDCPRCKIYEFTCYNGHCIDAQFKCDGKSDCTDHSDEDDCNFDLVPPTTCTSSNYQCSDGKCLDYSKVCNKINDCSDDEGGQCSKKCERSKCEQNCYPSPKGDVCYCNKGFELLSGSDTACIDINECNSETSSPCSQICFNTEGSYQCGCHDEFILTMDGHECKAVGGAYKFIYALHNELRAIDPNKADFLQEAGSPISDIAVDVRMNKLMYTVTGEGGLYVLNMKTKETEYFDSFPTGILLAYDWLTENIYMTSRNAFNKLEIYICNMKNKKCLMIYRFNQSKVHVTSMEIDPIHRFLFIVKKSSLVTTKARTEIVRLRLDGTEATTIVQNATLGDIKALSVDVQAGTIYFTEQRTQSLMKCDYKGENRATFIHQSARLMSPTAIDIFENHAYILDEAHGKIAVCKLYQDNECVDGYNVASSRTFIMSHLSKQPKQESYHLCKDHRCSEICVNADQGKKCLCSNAVGDVIMCKEMPMPSLSETSSESSSYLAMWIVLLIFLLLVSSVVAIFVYFKKKGFNYNMNIGFHKNIPISNELSTSHSTPREVKVHFDKVTKVHATYPMMEESNYFESSAPSSDAQHELPSLVDLEDSEDANSDYNEDDQQRLIK